jgi:hypothetical protein
VIGLPWSPRKVDDAGDADLFGDGEEVSLQPDEHPGLRAGVFDVAPAAVDGFVLVRVVLRSLLLLGGGLVVVADDGVDLVAGVVVTFPRKTRR